uniref:CaMBD domain-containing protein n=1 Tax=Brugia timori TaxID=42155 RepID=A0A0R3QE81_9BILA
LSNENARLGVTAASEKFESISESNNVTFDRLRLNNGRRKTLNNRLPKRFRKRSLRIKSEMKEKGNNYITEYEIFKKIQTKKKSRIAIIFTHLIDMMQYNKTLNEQ